ncbi:MAG: hypothetical protein AAGJ46_03550 [Planctomycetota bacterium]
MIRLALPTLVLAAFTVATPHAEAVRFTIDSSQSSLALDSAIALGAVPGLIAPGGGGETSLSGSLVADVTDTTFEILPGSLFVADDEGSFLPGIPEGPLFLGNNTTPAPASFAFFYPTGMVPQIGIDIAVALRDLTFSIDDTAPRALGGGVLGAGTPDLAIVSGEGHLNAGTPAISPLPVFGVTSVTSGPGTTTLVGNLMTISLPIELVVSEPGGLFSQSTYSGVIVASGVIPEPGSATLLAVFVGAGSLRRRGRYA